MQFGGKYVLSAQRMRVWEALNDTAVLKSCISGCRRIEWVTDTTLRAEIAVDLGIAAFGVEGDLILSDIIVAERYTLTGRGKAGWLGRARGAADVALADHPDGTRLEFTAQGDVDSGIARLGAALVGRSAQGVIDKFFARFAAAIDATSTPLKS